MFYDVGKVLYKYCVLLSPLPLYVMDRWYTLRTTCVNFLWKSIQFNSYHCCAAGNLECVTTGSRCVHYCFDLPDGDYQSCHGCHVYMSCVAEKPIYDRECASGQYWDDDVKECLGQSTTCTCFRKLIISTTNLAACVCAKFDQFLPVTLSFRLLSVIETIEQVVCELKQLAFTGSALPETVLLLI